MATTRSSSALSGSPRTVTRPGSSAGATSLWPMRPQRSKTLMPTLVGAALPVGPVTWTTTSVDGPLHPVTAATTATTSIRALSSLPRINVA